MGGGFVRHFFYYPMQKDRFDYSNCNYRDSFEYTISDPDDRIGIADISGIFADPGPKWVSWLMALRHRIVGCFGLKTEVAPDDGKQRVGLFELLAQTDRTMTLGEDDKHLDFRVLLSLSEADSAGRKRVAVSTLVKYNNRLGRIYFFFVKPFHRVIVPLVTKRKLRWLAALV